MFGFKDVWFGVLYLEYEGKRERLRKIFVFFLIVENRVVVNMYE